jgi:protein involved in polysaccharide export with SLBB domain
MPSQSQAEPRLSRRAVDPLPGEFELFVQGAAGSSAPIRRLGVELVTGELEGGSADLGSLVPPDYVVAPGDEVLVTLWGSVDADLRLYVDRTGRITIPRVGAVQVGGVRNSELTAVIERRVANVFRNFQLTATLGQLKGIRIFVTGFVTRPGTYTVSNLSTVVGALMQAGGPSAAGSFRQIELRRGASKFATFDLYDLLLKGDRSGDVILQAGDVVHVGSVGPQAGVIGSVNKPVVVELKPGETVADVLLMAGGFSAVADRSRLLIERLQDRQMKRASELKLPTDLQTGLSHGDVVRALSVTASILSSEFQNKRVRVEGEVLRPGDYLLPANSTLEDALKAAGGLTPAAHLFGTNLSRESVRLVQQENYERALRDLEASLTRSAASQRAVTAEQAAAANASASAEARLIERLRAVRPTGRIVLTMRAEEPGLPALAVEDGDRLYIPSRPSTVGVFGSVFNGGNYLVRPESTVEDILRLAGGPTKGADEGSIFVVRIDGSVISAAQNRRGWFSAGKALGDFPALPGDTIFVPEEMDKTTFTQTAKEWTQILAQFGLGVAAIRSLNN